MLALVLAVFYGFALGLIVMGIVWWAW
jgi:hypothetical protein